MLWLFHKSKEKVKDIGQRGYSSCVLWERRRLKNVSNGKRKNKRKL